MQNEKRGSWGMLLGGVAIGAAAVAAVMALNGNQEVEQQEVVQIPVPAEEVAAPEAQEMPKDVEEFLSKVSLGNTSVLNKAEVPHTRRNHAFETKEGVLAADGVRIRTDEPTMSYTTPNFDVTFTQQLTELRFIKDGEVVRRFEAKKSEASLEKKDAMSVIRYGDVFPDVDVKYTYDGTLVEEFVIFSDAFKKTLARSGADRVEVVSRFPEIKSGNAEMMGLATEGDATPITTSPLTTNQELELLHAMMPVARLPKSNAFVEGQQDDKKSHYIADRTLTIEDDGTDIAVALPATYLAEAAGTVYLDPSIIDQSGSQHGWTQGRRVVVDSEGLFHVVWMRNATYDDIGAGRWRMVYAYGDGTNWTYHGPIALPGPNTSLHQYYGGLAIDSQDNITVTWMEQNSGHPTDPNVWNIYWGRGYKENWTAYGKINEKPVNQYPGVLSVDSQDRVHLHYGSPNLAKWAYLVPPVMEWVDLGGQVQGSVNYAEGSGTVGLDDAFWIVNANTYTPQMLRCVPDFANGTGSCEFKGELGILTPDATTGGLSMDGMSASHRRTHQVSVAADSNGGFHAVWRMQVYQYEGQPHPQWGDRSTLPSWGNWRIAYGYHDGTEWVEEKSRIIDHDGFEAADPDDSLTANGGPGFNQDNPEITIDDNDNVHILYTEFSTPSKIIYWTIPAGGSLTPVGQLAPFSGAQHYANLRWSLHPEDPDGAGPLTGNAVISENIIEGLYVNDNSEMTFFSTGAPLELVDPREPVDHSFTNQTVPNFAWRRIALDEGTGNTTYKLEIATTPVFAPGDIILTRTGITSANYTLGSNGGDPTLADGQYYYWRVTASNSNGEGPAGFPFELGVDTQPPSAFNLLAPANGSDPQTKTPTFQWEASVDN